MKLCWYVVHKSPHIETYEIKIERNWSCFAENENERYSKVLHIFMSYVRLCPLKYPLSLIVSKNHTQSSIYLFIGTTTGWPYLLLINAGPALISLCLLPFVADSPRFLMIIKKDRINAEKGTHSRLFFYVKSFQNWKSN